jgi:uncharacterized membrane protein YeaQ/YmgE (transglycosylase-associated protein family)
MAASC